MAVKVLIKKIADKLADHIVGVILGLVITPAIVASVVICFWKWLKTAHSLEMLGWAWILYAILILVVAAILPIVIYRWRAHKGQKVSDTKDIQTLLEQWWLNWKLDLVVRPILSGSYVIKCSQIDKQCELKKSSAIKYLPIIIKKDSEYQITQQGKNTLKLAKKVSISRGAQEFARRMSEG